MCSSDLDFIYLSGGDTMHQMNYFNEINLTDILKKYEGVVLGKSAGAMNCSKTVFCAPEEIERLNDKTTWPGLGLTDLIIEPHFTLEPEEQAFRNILLEGSNTFTIYAIADTTHIVDNIIYGEAYLIKNSVINKLCDHGEKFIIKK